VATKELRDTKLGRGYERWEIRIGDRWDVGMFKGWKVEE
jgi:hypothetical protein